MIKGSTVIFNEAYIEELTRLRDNCRNKLEMETFFKERQKLEEQLNMYQTKLDRALDFQDVLDEVIHIDIPQITTIRTISGYVLPLKNIKVIIIFIITFKIKNSFFLELLPEIFVLKFYSSISSSISGRERTTSGEQRISNNIK